MDTNKNGVVDTGDGKLAEVLFFSKPYFIADPYGPYYPGDEWVDWVGMSIYHFGILLIFEVNLLIKHFRI